MTIQDLGSIGELVGALATVATLVYLGVQIHQNTRSVRASMHHAGSTAWSELLARIATDPAMAETYHQGRTAPESLSREELRRFDLAMDAMLAQIENFYVQYRAGQLPTSNQDRFATMLRLQFATPGVRRYWRGRRDLYTAEFVHYVERELALGGDAPP